MCHVFELKKYVYIYIFFFFDHTQRHTNKKKKKHTHIGCQWREVAQLLLLSQILIIIVLDLCLKGKFFSITTGSSQVVVEE